ncbi:MAG: YihY/virulence factor BrkB family protein [Peptoniphilus harei]|uniref:YihY/virulence factor BrkB family protein n=1 Tax=Peptoniphilus harei TaxID=54005 RepID=UPI00254FE0B8|nr:YihY/virulence factor BrkB family protein [Peptoniphilus harei]MDK7754919.1 YihY/virulence factor BrkB family protein [Peptoniphilus harei]MDK7760725.1 YihY/virulence factor BrkB family protein [Peptoniphilus harei]MDK8270516.1 YihY/virulence factor BrkB family protein [Peptoniphilus harei]MDK8340025.1 YihY/virulence factor BrkB family protein [Peptoniphilus harei]MDU7533099.1 YihY/virulence factor BrkB family protein [Peptoniphilus harei]
MNNFIDKVKDKKAFTFFDKLIYRVLDHDTLSYGGSLTYFLILSIFPFLISLINAINFSGILDPEYLYGLLDVLPGEIQEIIRNFLNELHMSSSGSFLTISFVAGLFTASTAVFKLMKIINQSYGFVESRGFLAQRLMALFFTLALILMIFLLVLTQIFGQIIYVKVMSYLGIENASFDKIWSIAKNAIPLAYMLITFILLYKFSPSKSRENMITIKSVLPGSIFATLGLIIASSGFNFYVSSFGKYSITYGSLGGIIVFLIWLYLLSTITLVGAEINSTLYSMRNFKSLNNWPRHDSIFKNLQG